jgi:TatD DNase family protein
MKFFDSHCHLQFDAFDETRDQIIFDMENDNSKAINVGSSIENSRSGILLSKKFPNSLYSSVGVHPFHSLGFEIYGDTKEAHDSIIKYPQDLNVLKELINLENIKAIGECGIDFSYFKDLNGSELDIEN